MKSLALLWATAGPDCRSLKLYWVSAKALTLPISHHGSSRLSLPSGLIRSPERINTQSLCSLSTWAFPLQKSQTRSGLISYFLAFHLCITTRVIASVSAIESWGIIVVSDGHHIILSSGTSAQNIAIFVLLDQLPEHSIRGKLYYQAIICRILILWCSREWGWASVGVMEGVWASDRSAGIVRQVRRCKAEQDDGLINPATPRVQWERLLSQPQRLCNQEVSKGAAEVSEIHTAHRLIVFDIVALP